MVLLSKIRLAQGRLDEAVHLASKALSFRRSLLGSRLKICDSLCQVADLLQRQGNIASAMYVTLVHFELESSPSEIASHCNSPSCEFQASTYHGTYF